MRGGPTYKPEDQRGETCRGRWEKGRKITGNSMLADIGGGKRNN